MPSFSMPVNFGDIGNIGNIGSGSGDFKMPNGFNPPSGSHNSFSMNFTTGSLDDIKSEAMDKFKMQYGDNPQAIAEMERMVNNAVSEASTFADDMFKETTSKATEQWGIDPSTTINIRK